MYSKSTILGGICGMITLALLLIIGFTFGIPFITDNWTGVLLGGIIGAAIYFVFNRE